MGARTVVEFFEGEYRRYKAGAEGALAQVADDELCIANQETDNAIVAIVWHLTGNLLSRFTDFRTTDGEKPDRNRESEFDARRVSRAALLERWERGWAALFAATAALSDADLHETVTIRRQPLRIDEALLRSLSHTAYHVGQIVYIAKALRGSDWKYLSIPRGGSDAYNRNPVLEHASAHAALLNERDRA